MIRKKAVLFILFLLLQLTGCMAPVEPTALNLTPVSTPTPTSTPTVIPPATPSPFPVYLNLTLQSFSFLASQMPMAMVS